MTDDGQSRSGTFAGAGTLRGHVQRFLRGFGVLMGDTTPCGHPISVSYAHALMVLNDISDEEEAPAMSELAAELGIDKSNVTRLCHQMEDAGHLELTRCADDARVRRLTLTSDGRSLAVRVDRHSLQRFERILSHVPEDDRGELLRGLAALSDAIEQTLGDTGRD